MKAVNAARSTAAIIYPLRMGPRQANTKEGGSGIRRFLE